MRIPLVFAGKDVKNYGVILYLLKNITPANFEKIYKMLYKKQMNKFNIRCSFVIKTTDKTYNIERCNLQNDELLYTIDYGQL